jgi:hypothetical protein
MVTLKARKLKLEDAHALLGYQPMRNGKFEDYLQLPILQADDIAALEEISENFFRYLNRAKISEGQAREFSVSPLLRLAGYHQSPIYLEIEEAIDRIYIEDEDTHITGRLDIVAVRHEERQAMPLWILVVESKNIEASEYVGIAQMLAYAYKSLERQNCVWGLVTNGSSYQFFYLQKGEKITYQYMPILTLREKLGSAVILQVLRAIREWQPG